MDPKKEAKITHFKNPRIGTLAVVVGVIVDHFLYIDQILATVTKDYYLIPSKGIKKLLTKVEHVCS